MAIDITKILEIIKDPDLKLKINDLYSENIKLKEENYNLKKKMDEMDRLTEIRSRMVHEDNHYYLKENDTKEGPYCTKCFDSDNKMIRLHKGNLIEGIQYYTCPNCKTHTSTGTHIPQSRIINRNAW